MGGDEWSFLDEEVARLDRKGGKGGGRRRRGGGGGGGGGGARDATKERGDDDDEQRAERRDAPFDEWSALDAELARIEGKGRSRRGETPTRETHRRDPPPPAPSHPPRQQRERQEQQEQQEQRRRQSPPPPPAPKADDDEDPVTRAAKMAERAARFANDASTRAEHAASNAASLKSRLGPPTPAPSKAKPDRGGEERGGARAAKATSSADADAARVDDKSSRHAGHASLLGTCESMCPDAERVDRERNGEIELFERVDPASSSSSSAQLCVKKFTRVVDNPSPSSIRTRAALDKTCAHLYGLLGGRCDYPDGEVSLLRRSNFLWDRLRSVRQDMGLQGLTNGGWAAARLEEMARFAIAAEYLLCENVATIHEPDGHNSHLHIEQLGKTLTTLAAVYADDEEDDDEDRPRSFPNRAEMTCYSLLLRMDDHGPFRNSASTFLAVLRAAPSDVQSSPEVQFALDARRAYAAVNAPAFFKLVRSKRCSYLQACLLHKYFDTIRYKALERVNCVMNKSPLPMAAVAAEVLFEESEVLAAEKCEACGLPVAREGESLWLRVKEAAFAEPGVEKAARRRRERWVERKAPAIKSANMFRWQALITGKAGR